MTSASEGIPSSHTASSACATLSSTTVRTTLAAQLKMKTECPRRMHLELPLLLRQLHRVRGPPYRHPPCLRPNPSPTPPSLRLPPTRVSISSPSTSTLRSHGRWPRCIIASAHACAIEVDKTQKNMLLPRRCRIEFNRDHSSFKTRLPVAGLACMHPCITAYPSESALISG